mmetsp:Transcript_22038/g.50920  ORF Transcript_22038/g.50920 Transcript_22038/m.50920 type:complete len:204 (-) Transcript_22038:1962-2573(-)
MKRKEHARTNWTSAFSNRLGNSQRIIQQHNARNAKGKRQAKPPIRAMCKWSPAPLQKTSWYDCNVDSPFGWELHRKGAKSEEQSEMKNTINKVPIVRANTLICRPLTRRKARKMTWTMEATAKKKMTSRVRVANFTTGLIGATQLMEIISRSKAMSSRATNTLENGSPQSILNCWITVSCCTTVTIWPIPSAAIKRLPGCRVF